ncbi:DNA cytosine methyltransferase [Roseicyclus sp. F158]|uniref:DNA (cytosine-5-)-methyltransferase n=1 Tax=Tropicimonas omnivorans TaxID=3075590 RepID=A0ABU3DJX0_9RHOB|nr:DNA cytosine methyltransferase [Roseicyclus sp. F158]MDT0683412.1 DNA cytosine methyltransferase [Roseicyclus sp. F158]
MKEAFGIVDLFSGPGGLGEGFCACPGAKDAFEIDVSVEKDPVAHGTLRLRAFLRRFGSHLPPEYIDFINRGGPEPDWSALYPREWAHAEREALNLTLGEPETASILDERIAEIRRRRGDRIVLIGGPPCQAYSLAGRGRKPSDLGYVAHDENRHLLYQEYINVLKKLRPAAFVMENVKGMLSSSIEKRKVFDLVTEDLRTGGGSVEYELFPLTGSTDLHEHAQPKDFVVAAEDHGVPQARHRVIIVGLRRDLLPAMDEFKPPRLDAVADRNTVRDVLSAMPVLRSGISSRGGHVDDVEDWRRTVALGAARIAVLPHDLDGKAALKFGEALRTVDRTRKITVEKRKDAVGGTRLPDSCPDDLRDWLEDDRLTRLSLHETRGHMVGDLERYLFASCWAAATGCSPKAADFPDKLAPKHDNWKSGKFNDRFRVQPWDLPSSTVTCHLSKDGHYFIHPDPTQCRSMTVREAARLQTFPDNYFFRGNRTQQYIQVGNAVPPFLASKIAAALHPVLSRLFDVATPIVDNGEKAAITA